MRLRKKKFLEQRLTNVSHLLPVRTGYQFYTTAEQQRYDLIDTASIFGNDNPTVLEIGCGRGSFANSYAILHKDVNILAVEKLSNVIVEACEQTQRLGLNNIRYLNCSAENLHYYIKPNSIEKIILNFSCPFPKSTYANRRLTCTKMLLLYQRLLSPGGTIEQKTDNLPFFVYSSQQYNACGYKTLELTQDMYNSPYLKDNIATEYETKFVGMGCPICYIKVTTTK